MARTKYATPNGILAAAHESGLDRSSFRQVPGHRVDELLDRILESFTVRGQRNRKANWLWEDFRKPTFSVQGSRNLDILRTLFPTDTPVWLVVEDWGRAKRGPGFWIFEGTLAGATATLKNHFPLEFYVVARSFEWLVAENHHDYLIAVGELAVTALRRAAG